LKILSNGNAPPEHYLLDMKQALFAYRMPRKFRKVNRLWLLLRGVTLWTIWIARNDLVFNQKLWNSARIEAAIWDGIAEYGKVAWGKVCSQRTNNQASHAKALELFDSNWGKHDSLCNRVGSKVHWNLYTQFRNGVG
jgi:hypothetical protein